MRSALLLRELVGPITLTPVVPVAGRPSYVARTKFDTLKLLENLDPDGGPDPGATSIGWWRRRPPRNGHKLLVNCDLPSLEEAYPLFHLPS